MRTLLLLLLLFLGISAIAQTDTCFNKAPQTSFTGRYFVMGQSPYPVYKKAVITIVKKQGVITLILSTEHKTSLWTLSFSNQMSDEEEVVDSYEAGGNTMVRLIYERGELTDVVFAQLFYSYHFLICYPHSL